MVLLLHGGAAHAHWFDAVLPALIERFHVVALDQRGHGESTWAAPPAYALPTEIWREVIARRQRYADVHATLVAGNVEGPGDLVALNLNLQQLAQEREQLRGFRERRRLVHTLSQVRLDRRHACQRLIEARIRPGLVRADFDQIAAFAGP